MGFMQQIQTQFFSLFLPTLHFLGLQQKPLQFSMCSRHTGSRLRRGIKGQIPKYAAAALATTSDLTETAHWDYIEKQVFLISRALRASS